MGLYVVELEPLAGPSVFFGPFDGTLFTERPDAEAAAAELAHSEWPQQLGMTEPVFTSVLEVLEAFVSEHGVRGLSS